MTINLSDTAHRMRSTFTHHHCWLLAENRLGLGALGGILKTEKKRLHGYDPAYDRMDRLQLITKFRMVFPDVDDDSLSHMTRSRLIDALLDYESDARHSAHANPENYPLRRPFEYGRPENLAEHQGQKIFWCWEKDPQASVVSLMTNIDNYAWNLNKPVEEGSLILTAINTTPPLIVSVELVDSVAEKETLVERVATFSNPISVLEVEQRLEMKLPRRSQHLTEPINDKVLGILSELMVKPAPIFVTNEPCAPGLSSPVHEAIFAVALLQNEHGEELICSVCERYTPPSLEAHLSRPGNDELSLEIQDQVDDVEILCSDCHEMVHQPSMQKVRAYAKPSCPECGERNPRLLLWGMPAGIPGDDVIVMGCVMPSGPVPEWECRGCETQYLVHKYLGEGNYLYPDSLTSEVEAT